MKIRPERQLIPLRNFETKQRDAFQSEKLRRKGCESCCQRSYMTSLVPRGSSELEHARVLIFELLQFSGAEKSYGIDYGQHPAVQNRKAAIPRPFFPNERMGQGQEDPHLRHFFN